MQQIKVGGDTGKEELKVILDKYFLNSDLNIEQNHYNDRFEFLFFPGRKESFYDISFYSQLGKVVNDTIMKVYIKRVIVERTEKICRDYSRIEKQELMESAHYLLLNENCFSMEKNRILEDVIDYIMENNSIIIDGFVNFRLNKFLYIIDLSIEKAISNYEVEKEYEEFIEMLKYFVEIQEIKTEVVNLFLEEEKYYLLDKDYQIIEEATMEDIQKEILTDEISKVDLLISSLIVLSPLKLIIHGENIQSEALNLISKIFKDKIEFCYECKICIEDRQIKNNKLKEVE